MDHLIHTSINYKQRRFITISSRMFSYYRYTRSLKIPAKISTSPYFKTTCRFAHTTHLFDELFKRDIYTLNSQLSSSARRGEFQSTWALFNTMHRGSHALNSYTFTPVLTSCSVLPCVDRGKQVHALMIKLGTDLVTMTQTALIDMYSKHGCLSDSIKVFEDIESHDVVSWNALLTSFLRHGLPNKAIEVFSGMKREGVEFSEFTLCSVLKACASLKGFQQGKQVHGLVVVMGRDLVVLGTALIDFYCGCRHVSEAMKVFYSLSYWRKDDVMFNSLISGCVKNRRYEEAFSIMSCIRPNVVGLTSALAACSENSDVWIGMQIHCIALRFGFTFSDQLCNVLLDMYAKCGKITKARLLFNSIVHKDVVSWTTMIDAYGKHGKGHEAVELFNKMGEESGVLPNSVTFLAVLSACSHSGLVEEGVHLFNLVREKYCLEPGVEHYTCYMDILARAGRTEHVWCVFDEMVKSGIRPTNAVWAALLNACCLNMDVSRGEFAAKHLLALAPDNPGNHVLLSNFYASIRRWDVVDSLRSEMKEKGLIKQPGSSWLADARNHDNCTQLGLTAKG